MLKFVFTFLLFGIVALACNPSSSSLEAKPKVPLVIEKVKANKMLTFEIQGMSCVMACGGSIRKELAKTHAVEKCEFDFEPERETNVVKVSFDTNKTSAKELIKIVTKLNDGQFKVGKSDENDVSVNIRTTITDIIDLTSESKS